METHPQEKVLVFSQFADTVRYLEQELKGARRGWCGHCYRRYGDPLSGLAFWPENDKRHAIAEADELRAHW